MTSISIPLQTTWTKIAFAGQNVVIQNLGGNPVVLTTATDAPVSLDGIQLDTLDHQAGVLAGDLYARSDHGGFILLADGLFAQSENGTNAATAPTNISAPVIGGTAQVGRTLSASNGSWAGSPTSYAYQWKRSGTAISAATGATYVPGTADVGAVLSVSVTATNASGSATATSAATSAVTAGATSSPGGGANNTADHSDANNAYLAAMAA